MHAFIHTHIHTLIHIAYIHTASFILYICHRFHVHRSQQNDQKHDVSSSPYLASRSRLIAARIPSIKLILFRYTAVFDQIPEHPGKSENSNYTYQV